MFRNIDLKPEMRSQEQDNKTINTVSEEVFMYHKVNVLFHIISVTYYNSLRDDLKFLYLALRIL